MGVSVILTDTCYLTLNNKIIKHMSEQSCINFQFGTQSNDKHVDNEWICEEENQFCLKE